MPIIDEKAYAEAQVTNGEFQKMGAGGYVVAVQAVRTQGEDSYHRPVNYVDEKQYVKLIYDVIEGEHAGRFSDDYWTGEDKDYAHCFYLSWKNLGALKGSMTAFDESNPGFDAMAAFRADQWGLFVGKKFGIVVGEEEYIGNDGTLKTRLTLPRIKSVADIHAGKFKVPALKKLDGGSSTTTASGSGQDEQVPADVYDESLPF